MIKTKLFGKSNAVLIEIDTNADAIGVAVITCDKDENITKKVELAISEDCCSHKVKIKGKHVLENQERIFFDAGMLTDDNEQEIRSYCLEILATY